MNDPLIPLSGANVIFPVDEFPRANVCPFVVPNTPRPERVVAIFPEFPEIEATGIPPETLMNANFEEAVDTPPKRRSRVALFGNRIPPASVHLDPPDPDPGQEAHVGADPPD